MIILSPRILPECENAFAKLPIDQFWIKNYTEKQIENLGVINKFVNSTNYDYYIIQGDDSIVPLESFLSLFEVLQKRELPIVTGWCVINEKCKRVNLRLKQPYFSRTLFHWTHKVKYISRATDSLKKSTFPYPEDLPEGLFRTYFVGWALTAIRRDILQRFPYRFMPTAGSDYPFVFRCNFAGIAMFAVKEARVIHLDAHYGWRNTEPITELVKWEKPSILS